jgi:UDP-N-acetylmuramyl pentapeptide synthase
VNGKKIEVSENDKERLEWIVRRIAAEKGRIITDSGCKVGIYNIDNQYVNEVITSYELEKKDQSQSLFSFGKDETNTVHFGRYEVSLDGTIFTFYLNWNEKKESILLKINNYVLPQEYQEIFASAILVGKYTGLSNFQITQSLQKNYTVPKSRSSLLQGIHDSVIIDSSYNASKAAVFAFLKMADMLKHKEKRPLVFIFGDMRELGDESQIEHEAVTEEILKTADYLYCVGELTQRYVMPKVNTLKESMHFENSVKAGIYLRDNLPEKALVLVKGSQNTIFLEEAVKQLLKNTEDEKKLCRQDNFWLKKKEYLYK